MHPSGASTDRESSRDDAPESLHTAKRDRGHVRKREAAPAPKKETP